MLTRVKNGIADLLSQANQGTDRESISRRLDALVEEAEANDLDQQKLKSQLDSWAVQFPLRKHRWISADAALADLRELLIGPQSKGAKTWNGFRRIADGVLDHYVAVASIVTVVASVFYGLAYTRFYDALDITPEQAGLTPPEILTRSALGGITLTLLVSIAVFAVFVPLVAVRDDMAARTERGTWLGVLANAFLTAIGIVLLVSLTDLAGLYLEDAVFLSVFPLSFLLLVSIRIRKLGERWSMHPRPLRFNTYRYVTIYLAFAVPLGLLATAALTLSLASFYGDQASEGRAVRDPKIAGLPFLGIRAEPALLSWKESEPRGSNPPHCVFYLGGSDGDAVFYDHRSHRTLHVPPGEVTIELRSDMTSCEAPVNVHPPSVSQGNDRTLVCHPGRWQTYLTARYTYHWITQGLVVGSDTHTPATFEATRRLNPRSLRCRVTARTTLGSSVAVSDDLRYERLSRHAASHG